MTRTIGKNPSGAYLARISGSPNFREGKFRNLSPTPFLTSRHGWLGSLWRAIAGRYQEFH